MPFAKITPFVVNYLELPDYIPGKSNRSEIFFGDWTNELLYVHTMEYYSIIKNEETTHAFSNMNESHSHNYAE